jgi:NADH-quinone oxidoreductase subunit N
MASVPCYAVAGFLKHRRRSTEAALKYAVFGAGAAGVMLYGISLLVGTLGSAHLPTMAVQLADMLEQPSGIERTLVLALGGLMVMVGLAFKLSAVPFHFWAPDVFEGATAEVGAFLSIASKAAALGLLVRVALGLSYASGFSYGDAYSAAESRPSAVPVRLASLVQQGTADETARVSATSVSTSVGSTAGSRAEALRPVRRYIGALVALLAAVTCTFGNLAAYGQTNMKRLLAYSTIAHAGYMMMPVAAAVALIDAENLPGARAAVGSLAFYIWIYVFMNLGAFAGVAFLRNALGSEEIADYAGLVRRSPGLTICLAVVMFSLVGLPPLAGFAAKFTIFAEVYHAGLLALLAIGGLNTVLSLFYYLRVVKVMVLEPEPPDRKAAEVPMASGAGLFCLTMAAMLVGLGVGWEWLFAQAQLAVSTLLL